MHYLALLLLGLGFLFSMMQGFTIGTAAASAMHQIYGALWFVVAAVCLSGAGIIAAIMEKFSEFKRGGAEGFKLDAEQHILPPPKPE